MAYNPNASGIYNSTPPTLTNGQSSAIQLDVNGNQKVAVQGTVPVSGAVSVSGTPTVTVGNASLAVTGTFWQATQPVSLASLPALATGTNVIGSVKVTDGTNFQPTGDSSARSIHTTIDNASIAVTGTFYQATQPVSGTVTANAGTGTFTVAGTVTANAGTGTFNTTDANAQSQGSTTSGQKGFLELGSVTTAAPTYTTGQSSPISLTTAGALRVDASATTQPISGSVSISGTPTVTVGNASLAVTGTFWQATQPISGTVTANAGSGTFNTTDANAQSQGSTTSGQKGFLELGAVTTSAPSYTTGQTSPLSLDTSGNVRTSVNNTVAVSGTFWQSTQPVSIASSVTVAQATASNLNATVTLASSQTITDVPATSGGWSANVQQAITSSAQVKSSAGQVGGYSIFNSNSGAAYVFWYNTTSAPTIGSTTNLVYQVGVPAGGGAHIEFGKGIAFSSGIYVAASTSATSSAAPSTGLVVTTLYK